MDPRHGPSPCARIGLTKPRQSSPGLYVRTLGHSRRSPTAMSRRLKDYGRKTHAFPVAGAAGLRRPR